MKEEKIRIAVVEPMSEPKIITIPNTLESMQRIVGGLIEITMLEGYNIVVNEEGKINGGLQNRDIGHDIIIGTFFVCNNDEEGNLTSLTDVDVMKVKKMFGTCDTKYPALIGYFRI